MSKVYLPTGDHMKSWGLKISRHLLEDAGPFIGGGWKLVWHTTEGGTLSSVVETLKEKRAAVHAVIDPSNGHVVQCVRLDRAGRGLEHPAGTPETNRANAIQVEIVGFAKQAHDWPDSYYKRLAALAVLIMHRVDIPNRNAGNCRFDKPQKITDFVRATGHCGHVHVPHNNHTDPGIFRGYDLKRFINERMH